MKFGSTFRLDDVDLPEGGGDFGKFPSERVPMAVGLGMWNRSKIKNFFPREIKDQLAYYSTQFNSIELNATFHKIFPASTFIKWRDTTANGFTFFPKIPQEISHFNRFRDFERLTEMFVEGISYLGDKLGVVFAQCHNNFAPRDFDRLQGFIKHWKRFGIPLAVEVRHEEWHKQPFATEFYGYLEENRVQNVLIDTPGRRDLMHMRFTAPAPFIRWVGCNNDEVDLRRLDDWAERISQWQQEGLRGVAFFLHQHEEKESAKLAAHFIKRLNELSVTDLEPPTLLNRPAPHLEQ